MKVRRFTIVTHALIWILLLVVPYVSTDQVFNALEPSSGREYLLLSFALSTVLIIVFYFNGKLSNLIVFHNRGGKTFKAKVPQKSN